MLTSRWRVGQTGKGFQRDILSGKGFQRDTFSGKGFQRDTLSGKGFDGIHYRVKGRLND